MCVLCSWPKTSKNGAALGQNDTTNNTERATAELWQLTQCANEVNGVLGSNHVLRRPIFVVTNWCRLGVRVVGCSGQGPPSLPPMGRMERPSCLCEAPKVVIGC